MATSRLVFAHGANPARCFCVDSKGLLHKGRADIELHKAEFVDKWKLCQLTNAENRMGGISEALRGADVCIAFSAPGPGLIQKEWISAMARDSIVFACANPVPEIWPWEAREAGAAIIATGRSDFPNQVNNSLGFPGIFRGALDVRAKTITDEMCLAAAEALGQMAMERGLSREHILPTMEEWQVFPHIAVAVALKAQEQGVARLGVTAEQEFKQAAEMIKRAQKLNRMMIEQGFIATQEFE